MNARRSILEIVLVGIIWIVFLIVIPSSFSVEWPVEFWYRQCFFGLLLTVVYLINRDLLMPRILDKGNVAGYVMAVAGLILGILVLVFFFEKLIGLPKLIHELFNDDEPYDPSKHRRRFDFSGFLLILFNFSIGIIVHLFRRSQQEAELRRELEKLQATTELSYLKAQINPHFFFNTLNNIYALTEMNVQASREALLKLSSMMRYVLYEEKNKQTSVAEEIRFIENYIELMKLRLTSRVHLNFDRPENPPELSVAPMILLPFVENAFKHGVSGRVSTEITITIRLAGSMLHFRVENTIVPRTAEDHDASGIGIANTRRRLELLYPGKHHFEFGPKGDTFIADMSIDLS